jgi:putative membrane protein
MNRTAKDYAIISLKGMAMGAADVVPGVSGGTIAFISGIYTELIDSIKGINFSLIKVLKNEGIPAFIKAVNAPFLIALLSGIAISIISLSKLIGYLLANHPIIIWSFFFGLIVCSAWLIGKSITKWTAQAIISLVLGIGIAYYITIASPTETTNASWFVFLSGAIAICAMILPGISGSFILLLLGKYAFIMESISKFDIKVILPFLVGCAFGLLAFSRFLSWLLHKHYTLTIALLSGFMIGSLNKVWPWKITLETRINSKGVEVPFLQESVLPGDYIGDAQVLLAIVFMLIGFGLIYLLERFSNVKSANQNSL